MTTDIEAQVRGAFREAPVPPSDPVRADRVRDGARARRRRRTAMSLVVVGAAAALAVVPGAAVVRDLQQSTQRGGVVVAGGLPAVADNGSPLAAQVVAGDGGQPGRLLTVVPQDLNLSVRVACTGSRALSGVVLVNGIHQFATDDDCGGQRGQRTWTYRPSADDWKNMGVTPGRPATIEAILVERGTQRGTADPSDKARINGPTPVTGGVGDTRLSLGLYGAVHPSGPAHALPAMPFPWVQDTCCGVLLSGVSRPLTPAFRTFSFVVVPRTTMISIFTGCSAFGSKQPVAINVTLDGRVVWNSGCRPDNSYRHDPLGEGEAGGVYPVMPGKPITLMVTASFVTSGDLSTGHFQTRSLDTEVPEGGVIVAAYTGARS